MSLRRSQHRPRFGALRPRSRWCPHRSCPMPVQIFVRSPLPLMTPARLALLPLVSNVPPPALSVTPRFEVKPARYCSVPPPKLSPPDVLPRLASVLTASVPALIVVPPLYVLV